MNINKIENELKLKYPNKSVIVNHAGEIICEIQPSSVNPKESIAIAVIDKSFPHYHKIATEIYEVVRGRLFLTCENKQHILNEGEVFAIKPNQIHFTEGKEVWVKCTSRPGWAPQDHFNLEEPIS